MEVMESVNLQLETPTSVRAGSAAERCAASGNSTWTQHLPQKFEGKTHET